MTYLYAFHVLNNLNFSLFNTLSFLVSKSLAMNGRTNNAKRKTNGNHSQFRPRRNKECAEMATTTALRSVCPVDYDL
jgi:hypothetical protein